MSILSASDVRELAATHGRGREVLSKAFDKVSSPNWKDPIDAFVDCDAQTLLDISYAVTFYTGSVARVDAAGPNLWRVRAAGYYATIGA